MIIPEIRLNLPKTYKSFIFIHDKYLARLMCSKMEFRTINKIGYWVEWSGSAENGTFYDEDFIDKCPSVELVSNGRIVTDEEKDTFWETLRQGWFS